MSWDAGMQPREDAHAGMVVQRDLVALGQAEDAQGEGWLLVDVHVCHGRWPAAACMHTLSLTPSHHAMLPTSTSRSRSPVHRYGKALRLTWARPHEAEAASVSRHYPTIVMNELPMRQRIHMKQEVARG